MEGGRYGVPESQDDSRAILATALREKLVLTDDDGRAMAERLKQMLIDLALTL